MVERQSDVKSYVRIAKSSKSKLDTSGTVTRPVPVYGRAGRRPVPPMRRQQKN